jgi:hypothetical protein
MYTPCHFAFQTGFNGDEDGGGKQSGEFGGASARATRSL